MIDIKQSREKECNHQFWKDRNPSNCLNCGKTEKELFDQQQNALVEVIKKWAEEKLEIQKKVQEKAKEIVVIGRKKVNEMLKDKYIRQGKIQALEDLTKTLDSLISNNK